MPIIPRPSTPAIPLAPQPFRQASRYSSRCGRSSRSTSSTLGLVLSGFHGGCSRQPSPSSFVSPISSSRSPLNAASCACVVLPIGVRVQARHSSHPQPLLQAAQPVLLPEPRAGQFRHLRPVQSRGAGGQREALAVAVRLGDRRLDRRLVARRLPQAQHLFPAHGPLAPVDEDAPPPPRSRPASCLPGRGQPPAPQGHPPALALLARRRRQGVQDRVAPQPRQELDARLVRVVRHGQRPRHAPEGGPAVEDAQVLAWRSLGVLALHPDEQLALGLEGEGSPFWGSGIWLLRKQRRPATGRKRAGRPGSGSKAPVTTQL